MRHTSSGTLVNLGRRLPRTVAGGVARLADLDAVRALTALAVTAGVGASAVVAVASVSRPSNEAGRPAVLRDRPGTTASRGGERPGTDSPGDDTAAPGPFPPSAPIATRSHSPGPAARSTAGSDAAPPGRRQGSRLSAGGRSSGPSAPGRRHSRAPADRTPPDTRLTARFPGGEAAVFSFHAGEDASFACSLDGAPFTPCDSPARLRRLHPGWHSFAVRARDAARNVDPSPAEVRWHTNGGSSSEPGDRRR